MDYEQLKLENQLCFPVYAASRLIIREYQPLLDKLGITYPQYLVLMVLWEQDDITVNEIAGKLILNTNTITPLLKRMEAMGILTRKRSGKDERKVMVRLTKSGVQMRELAAEIPMELVKRINGEHIDTEKLLELKKALYDIISLLNRDVKSPS